MTLDIGWKFAAFVSNHIIASCTFHLQITPDMIQEDFIENIRARLIESSNIVSVDQNMAP